LESEVDIQELVW